MCTSPILIRNRKYKDINVRLRSSYIKVPCGVCDECLSQRSNDLYVRAHYEFDDCLRNGGCGFMCCLTYENYQLPLLHLDDKAIMVFNKKHCIDFIKRLRTILDRMYQKFFQKSAPDFKYLITSEYGSDPDCTHRPHYHLLFFFKENIGINTFKVAFTEAQFIRKRKSVKRVFGRVFQCDLLDPKRGGIKYSGKYILKDVSFENNRKEILNRINFYKDYVNNIHGIFVNPRNGSEEFRNKCIRSSKEYRKDVDKYVRPYSHMLQFYMLSNDLGVSAIVNKYGDNLVSLPSLSFENFTFRLPKLVKQRIEQNFGSKKSDELARTVFVNYVNKALDWLVSFNKLSFSDAQVLCDFAKNYIYPYAGSYYLVNPSGLDFRLYRDCSHFCFHDILRDEMHFFDDNGFFEMRSSLFSYLSLYDSPENREVRAALAAKSSNLEKEKYVEHKRNSSYKNGNVL